MPIGRGLDEFVAFCDALKADNSEQFELCLDILDRQWKKIITNIASVFPDIEELLTEVKKERSDFVFEPAYKAIIETLSARSSMIEQMRKISIPNTVEAIEMVRQVAMDYAILIEQLRNANHALAEYLTERYAAYEDDNMMGRPSIGRTQQLFPTLKNCLLPIRHDTNIQGIVAPLTNCNRSKGALTIDMQFLNITDKKSTITLVNHRNYDQYIVMANSKRYLILRDTDKVPLATPLNYMDKVRVEIGGGVSYTFWAMYPTRPVEVKSISFYMPFTRPFDDVPITDSR